MSMVRRASLAAVIIVWQAIAALAQQQSSVVPPQKAPERTTAKLKADVDKLLASNDPASIQAGIGDVFALVDRMVESQQRDAAFQYLPSALKYNPWALDYQLLYAEMLQVRGQSDAAQHRAKVTLEYAEKDEQINRARKLLGQAILPEFPKIKAVEGRAITLVLVPVGKTDRCVVEELRNAIEQKLGIAVLVQDAQAAVPEPKRDLMKTQMAQLRDNLRKQMAADPNLSPFLRQKGITIDKLDEDSVLVRAYRQIYSQQGGARARAEFDAAYDQLTKAGKQCEVEDLKESVVVAVRPFEREGVYFMGVANLDVFHDKLNFVFGWAENNGHHAMISYRRFTADFNDDKPNRKRLVERTLKQSLSSFGFMLGVMRCSSPTCVRAYPNSLVELDAKSTELCDVCRAGFEKALGRKLKGKD